MNNKTTNNNQENILNSISALSSKDENKYGVDKKVWTKRLKIQIIIIAILSIIFLAAIAGGGYLIWYTQEHIKQLNQTTLNVAEYYLNVFLTTIS